MNRLFWHIVLCLAVLFITQGCSVIFHGKYAKLESEDIENGVKLKNLIYRCKDTQDLPKYIKEGTLAVSYKWQTAINVLEREGYLPEHVVVPANRVNRAYLSDLGLAAVFIPLTFYLGGAKNQVGPAVATGAVATFAGIGVYYGTKRKVDIVPKLSDSFIRIPDVSRTYYKLHLFPMDVGMDMRRVPQTVYIGWNALLQSTASVVSRRTFDSTELDAGFKKVLKEANVVGDSSSYRTLGLKVVVNKFNFNTVAMFINSIMFYELAAISMAEFTFTF